MVLTNVEHAELYVGDAVLSAYYFCHALGFRMVASGGPESGLAGQRSFVLEQGAARLVVTSALGAEGEVAEYVRAHGDSVRDIALGTPDVVAAFDQAVRRGARPVARPAVFEAAGQRVVKATLAGPGGWVHSLIQRDTPGGAFLPGVYLPVDTGPSGGASLFRDVDHLAFALRAGTLLDTVAFYVDVLGFEETHQEDVRTEYSGMSSRVVQAAGGRICFPLQEPVSGTRRGQLEDFVDAHGGAGVQHLAFLADDIVRAVDSLGQRGVGLLDAPRGYYEALEARLGSLGPFPREQLQSRNILMDRDAWGVLLQVFTRSQHARRTLFFEVIQRHQARGFGGANIQALYAAKEQDATRAVG
ncbi:4-hydroxyphenylpyruvate dioxygenase [Myxococcus sp. MISCRS1]|uniref:4-hydroxyphenylpyruvate dioxygenase n=1 Tax=unclassified Myxococcus TaxID=2648731 RepID=UPI001CBFF2BE|nr:4-hydroxyphenylpyruvate dioxygenase [Myxococcus sp. MISCRS1]MBZ4413420.1 4-hydroxyphenylpyruvate dioxygenase [Myxococcus sp. XM-1-1-1]MCY0995897.1 4-hydroxyphenylpyruvate dioxygenase [Myxococcus sp. MISCRS1]